MLKGKKVNLVRVEKKDLEQLMHWRNNPRFRKHFREYRELGMSNQREWYKKMVADDPSTMIFSIRRAKDDILLGCCGLVYINWVYKHADLSLYIGWKDAYIDEKGYAKESCKLLFDYAFDELGLNKIWTEIYVFDKKKLRLYDTFGFHTDGVLRENYYYKGRFWDSYILSLLHSEWRQRHKKG